MTLEMEREVEQETGRKTGSASSGRIIGLIAVMLVVFGAVLWLVSSLEEEPIIVAPTDSGGYVDPDWDTETL